MDMKKYVLLLWIVLGLFACSDDDGGTGGNGDEGQDTIVKQGRGVFICNEGNFMYGNASLSFYDSETNIVRNQVFFNANNFPLGDVCQSMSIWKGKGFVVINNSGKIVVVNVANNKYLGKISGLTSPRYIEFISDTKAYVTDLYSPSIAVFNPQTYEVTGYVQIGKGTEQMVRYGNYLYACSWSFNNKVYKIDINTDKTVDSLTVTKQPNSMVIDKNNKIWVLSDGGYDNSPYGQEKGALTRIDAQTFAIEQVLEFPEIKASPTKLSINGARDTIYYINGSWNASGFSSSGIYRMGVGQQALPDVPFVSENGRLFYALGIDPLTSEVYLSDTIDYVQKGWILRFSAQGELKDKIKVDIAPGAFCFKTE